METLDNRCVVVVLGGAEINGTQWQKLDLKQEINTALSAYIASELALKEKKKISVWSCWVVGLLVGKRSLDIYFVIAEYLLCACPLDNTGANLHTTQTCLFYSSNMFLIIPFDPAGSWNAVEVSFWLKGITLSKSCQN